VITEALVAGARKRRVVRDLVLDAEAAEPAIGEVDLDLAAQRTLRADGEHVADDEHPDHENRINRRTANRRIVRRQLGADPRKIENGRNPAHQMVVRNHGIEIERIEQLALILIASTHHRMPSPILASGQRNHCSGIASTDFCNKIGHEPTSVVQ